MELDCVVFYARMELDDLLQVEGWIEWTESGWPVSVSELALIPAVASYSLGVAIQVCAYQEARTIIHVDKDEDEDENEQG